jgi:hypothetical protein
MESLKDEAKLRCPIVIEANLMEWLALEEDLPAGGYVKAAQQLQQRGFAAAACPTDRNVIA